jgi:hypothetical protein
MRRRTVLGTLLTGWGASLAGCTGPRVEGEVVSNETPLALSHDYATQGTPSGTRLVVDVTARNEGNERLTPVDPVPRVVCSFLDDAGGTVYRSGREVTDPVGIGETVTLEFTLGVDVAEVTRYELRSEWTNQ